MNTTASTNTNGHTIIIRTEQDGTQFCKSCKRTVSPHGSTNATGRWIIDGHLVVAKFGGHKVTSLATVIARSAR